MQMMPIAITCRKMMRPRIDLNRRLALNLCKEIPYAAYRMDLYRGSMLEQLLAQAVNIDLDRIRGDLVTRGYATPRFSMTCRKSVATTP